MQKLLQNYTTKLNNVTLSNSSLKRKVNDLLHQFQQQNHKQQSLFSSTLTLSNHNKKYFHSNFLSSFLSNQQHKLYENPTDQLLYEKTKKKLEREFQNTKIWTNDQYALVISFLLTLLFALGMTVYNSEPEKHVNYLFEKPIEDVSLLTEDEILTIRKELRVIIEALNEQIMMRGFFNDCFLENIFKLAMVEEDELNLDLNYLFICLLNNASPNFILKFYEKGKEFNFFDICLQKKQRRNKFIMNDFRELILNNLKSKNEKYHYNFSKLMESRDDKLFIEILIKFFNNPFIYKQLKKDYNSFDKNKFNYLNEIMEMYKNGNDLEKCFALISIKSLMNVKESNLQKDFTNIYELMKDDLNELSNKEINKKNESTIDYKIISNFLLSHRGDTDRNNFYNLNNNTTTINKNHNIITNLNNLNNPLMTTFIFGYFIYRLKRRQNIKSALFRTGVLSSVYLCHTFEKTCWLTAIDKYCETKDEKLSLDNYLKRWNIIKQCRDSVLAFSFLLGGSTCGVFATLLAFCISYNNYSFDSLFELKDNQGLNRVLKFIKDE
ncbi:hypothetical protein ABK040_004247 [Willaertia magna]